MMKLYSNSKDALGFYRPRLHNQVVGFQVFAVLVTPCTTPLHGKGSRSATSAQSGVS